MKYFILFLLLVSSLEAQTRFKQGKSFPSITDTGNVVNITNGNVGISSDTPRNLFSVQGGGHFTSSMTVMNELTTGNIKSTSTILFTVGISGDTGLHISSMVAGVTGSAITIPNNGEVKLGRVAGHLFVVTDVNEASQVCHYLVRIGFGTVELTDGGSICSITAGTANSINIYQCETNYTCVENTRGGDREFYFSLAGRVAEP